MDEFQKFLEQVVESTKFGLFYDIWVEKSILEALGEFSTHFLYIHRFLAILMAYNVKGLRARFQDVAIFSKIRLQSMN